MNHSLNALYLTLHHTALPFSVAVIFFNFLLQISGKAETKWTSFVLFCIVQAMS